MAASPDQEVVFRQEEHGQGDRDDDEIEHFEEASDYEEPEQYREPVGRFIPKKSIVMKPETFSGADDWQEYISHFEVCAELGRWDSNEMVLALAACLRGPARTFYISLPPADRQPYKKLVEKLEQRFGSSRQQNRWLSKFESRKRQPQETIAALADDLRQMSQRAYSNLDTKAQDALALNQLYKCISLEMKCKCIDKDCQTIAEAVEVAERYEGILGDDKKKQTVKMVKESNSPLDKSGESTGLEDTMKRLEVRLERLEETLKRSPDSRPRRQNYGNTSNSGCYICKAPDHFMRNCPMKKRQRNENSNQNQGNFQPSA